jgi:hypothetical protein
MIVDAVTGALPTLQTIGLVAGIVAAVGGLLFAAVNAGLPISN